MSAKKTTKKTTRKSTTKVEENGKNENVQSVEDQVENEVLDQPEQEINTTEPGVVSVVDNWGGITVEQRSKKTAAFLDKLEKAKLREISVGKAYMSVSVSQMPDPTGRKNETGNTLWVENPEGTLSLMISKGKGKTVVLDALEIATMLKWANDNMDMEVLRSGAAQIDWNNRPGYTYE